ncbi:hypothetical protein BA190_18825 [Labrys sp. WJW]|nr:hypothetical protein BA190_18825 [Labrys sp. WJW]
MSMAGLTGTGSALVSPNDILSRHRHEFAFVSSQSWFELLFQPVPGLVLAVQITADQGPNIFAGVLVKAVLANLLLEMRLQPPANADVDAVVSGHEPILHLY